MAFSFTTLLVSSIMLAGSTQSVVNYKNQLKRKY